MPDPASLGVGASGVAVVRFTATPPGQDPFALFFLVVAPEPSAIDALVTGGAEESFFFPPPLEEA
jgi:hypothetical protein